MIGDAEIGNSGLFGRKLLGWCVPVILLPSLDWNIPYGTKCWTVLVKGWCKNYDEYVSV